MSAPDELPTRPEIFSRALQHLELARADLSEGRDRMAWQAGDRRIGVGALPAVDAHRGQVYAAIAAAEGAIGEASAVFAPSEDRLLGDPFAEFGVDLAGR